MGVHHWLLYISQNAFRILLEVETLDLFDSLRNCNQNRYECIQIKKILFTKFILKLWLRFTQTHFPISVINKITSQSSRTL